MELLTKEIPFSTKDKVVNVILPSQLNEDLAEFVGIVIGDGHLHCFSKQNWNSFSITITCSSSEDEKYFSNVIQPLFMSLFNSKLRKTYHKYKNYFNANNCSKAIVLYLNKNFSIPIGNKSSNVSIPGNIVNSGSNVKAAFICGLADTDFSLSFKKRKKSHSYPVIKYSLKSKTIILQLNEILTEFGFKTNIVLNEKNFDKRFNINYERHSIYLPGKSNLGKWISLIGYNNPRLITKYILWKKFGYCPPNTTLGQRIALLSGDKISAPGKI